MVFGLWAISKTRSKSSLPIPFTKMYSFPVFSKGTIWSKPTSRPLVFVLLLPPKDPELTTTAWLVSIKAPIIFELLDGKLLPE